MSLKKDIFPHDIKLALINPLLKSETLNNNELENYRPISNLSFLSKIIKIVVLRQLIGT